MFMFNGNRTIPPGLFPPGQFPKQLPLDNFPVGKFPHTQFPPKKSFSNCSKRLKKHLKAI